MGKRAPMFEAEELERALRSLDAAEKNVCRRMKRAFRPGDLVTCHYAMTRRFEAEVVTHDGADTLAVRNVKTGKLRRRFSVHFISTDHYRGRYVR